MKLDLSLRRNSTALATSSLVPIREIGVFEMMAFLSSSDIDSFILPYMRPGHMALTRILLNPSSFANASVKLFMAPLLAE